MAFRVEKRIGAVLTAALFLAPGFGQGQLSYRVWYPHVGVLRKHTTGEFGEITISDTGVAFNAQAHSWAWAYRNIEQLKLSGRTMTVLTYSGNKLGADREYRFELEAGKSFADAYPFLKSRMDQRFVAAMPGAVTGELWEIPVKHLLRFGGEEGVLEVGADAIVYKAAKDGDSRTWRYEDIENIGSSGPFQLTVTSYERARTHYGVVKEFNFQLKERLDEGRYNELWMRLERDKGLKILDSYGKK
jgi:hypothetical protein